MTTTEIVNYIGSLVFATIAIVLMAVIAFTAGHHGGLILIVLGCAAGWASAWFGGGAREYRWAGVMALVSLIFAAALFIAAFAVVML